ncbi:MAG: tetratricopeptide repeat protein [Acidobacteriaceae bacterium]
MSSRAAFLLVCWIAVGVPWSHSQTSPAAQDPIQTHSRLAHQYLAQQRPDLAIPELQKVVALDPSNLDARVNLGVLLFFRGDYAGAVPQLRAAVAIQPDLWKQRALLGLAEGQLHDTASRTDLEAAFPHLTEEKFQREVGQALIDQYTATEDLDKAAMVVSELLATRPMDTGLLYLSYRLYSDLAGRSMLTLALTAPNSAEMHQVMARELARHGDNTAAIANYREALRINPRLAGLHSELADLLYHSDDEKLKAEAPAEFEAAVAENPNDEGAILSLGMIAAENADLKTAYADDARAVQLDPNDSDACTELAKVLVLMNERDKAEQMLERAVQADPSNYVAHYRLAGLYRQQGKIELATKQVAEYQKYRQMKDKLQKVFEDMRVAAAHRLADEETGPAH